MDTQERLNRTYHTIVRRLVATGRAPHYTEIAAELKISMDEGRSALHELMDARIPGCWLFPDTDYIGSFAPFSNLPTQYAVHIDGQQKWFGQ